MLRRSKKILTFLLPFAAACCAIQPNGWAETQNDSQSSVVRERLVAKYPNTKIGDVRKSEIAGVYEVSFGKSIAYLDESGRYILFGHLYDADTQRDITAERLERMQRLAFDELPDNAAIIIKQGDGSRKLAVFSDPRCPYCQRLEPELAKINNVTIHVYMLVSRPESRDLAEQVWCATDRTAAWRAAVTKGEYPKTRASCDTPLQQIAAIAKKAKLSGTPTLVSGDGRIKAGAASAQDIETWMAAGEQTDRHASVVRTLEP